MSNPFTGALESEAGRIIIPVGLGIVAIVLLYEGAKKGLSALQSLNPANWTFPSWAGGDGSTTIGQAFNTPATGFDANGNAGADLSSDGVTLTDPYTTNNF